LPPANFQQPSGLAHASKSCVPLGLVHITLVILQPVAVGYWCTSVFSRRFSCC
jgi:hypothetical protein